MIVIVILTVSMIVSVIMIVIVFVDDLVRMDCDLRGSIVILSKSPLLAFYTSSTFHKVSQSKATITIINFSHTRTKTLDIC